MIPFDVYFGVRPLAERQVVVGTVVFCFQRFRLSTVYMIALFRALQRDLGTKRGHASSSLRCIQPRPSLRWKNLLEKLGHVFRRIRLSAGDSGARNTQQTRHFFVLSSTSRPPNIGADNRRRCQRSTTALRAGVGGPPHGDVWPSLPQRSRGDMKWQIISVKARLFQGARSFVRSA